MSLLVLVTRPLEQAKDFAEQIKSVGHQPLLCPLLSIEYIPTSFVGMQKPDAILLSSVQAVVGVKFPADWFLIPVYCVGQKTEQAARNAGFTATIIGAGDMRDTLPLLKGNLPQNANLLYLRGEDVATDIQSQLNDIQVTEKITYRARPVTEIDESVLAQFPKLDVVTVFSARTGQILREIMERHDLILHAKTINLLCLSQAVVESFDGMDWKSRIIADAPNQNALLESLIHLK